MSEAFVGEIRIFAFGFGPPNWARCDGRLLPIAENDALFSLLGTEHGGDGETTFALPNLVPGGTAIGAGAGPGLTNRPVGSTGGAATVKLSLSESPQHTHQLMASALVANVTTPTAASALARSNGVSAYVPPVAAKLVPLADNTVGSAPGGGAPHNNLMPYQVLTYCICTHGVVPPSSE